MDPTSFAPMALQLNGVESVAVIIGVIIGGIGFLLTLATLLGGNYRAVKSAKIVADYEAGYKAIKAKAEGQEEQISELQRENSDKERQITQLKQEVADLEGRMAVLQEVVTGKSAIDALAGQLATMAEAMNSRYAEILGQVGELRSEVHTAHSQILTAVSPSSGGSP